MKETFKPGADAICVGCSWARKGAECTNPDSKANGGRGLRLKDESCTGRLLLWDSKLFEPEPRFTGCPPICTQTNLPALSNREGCLRFHEEQNPRGKVVKKPWRCDFCNSWHYICKAAPPSGASSNTERKT